jgi:penicillin-binding protein 1A
VTGGSLPVNIWHDFMAEALAGVPPRDIPLPNGSGGLLAAGELQPMPGAEAAPTTTASAEEPGLLDRLVTSILGGDSSADDSGAVHQKNTAKAPDPAWKNREQQDARHSK